MGIPIFKMIVLHKIYFTEKTEQWEKSVLPLRDCYLKNLWKMLTVEKYAIKNDMSIILERNFPDIQH